MGVVRRDVDPPFLASATFAGGGVQGLICCARRQFITEPVLHAGTMCANLQRDLCAALPG